MDLNKVASVLEAMAGYVEEHEAHEQAKTAAVKEGLIASIGQNYTATTGEEISDDLLKKLAGMEPPVLEAIKKVAESKKEPDQTKLGEASDKRDFSVEPETKKEASEMAEDRFLTWILE